MIAPSLLYIYIFSLVMKIIIILIFMITTKEAASTIQRKKRNAIISYTKENGEKIKNGSENLKKKKKERIK